MSLARTAAFLFAPRGSVKGTGSAGTRQSRFVRLLARRIAARLATAMSQSTSYSRGSAMVLFGVIAVVGHPLYYVLWHYFYPQPFDSLPLRLLSGAVCIPIVFEPWLSRYALYRRILPIYWVLLVLYELPFFFTVMSLMNGFSTVWALSLMVACLFLVLLMFEWLLVLVMAVIGSSLAWVVFLATDQSMIIDNPALLEFAPVYLFALVGGSVFNYKAELAANERLAGVTAAVGTMAHELRTPLLGIRSGASGLQRYFPIVLEGYELARSQGLPVTPIRGSHYQQMTSVLDRIVAETEYSSAILDMLVMNSNRRRIDQDTFVNCQISACIEAALDRYPFQSLAQRDRVIWDSAIDFRFFGSDILTVHVLFNLLKNALYFLDRADDGHIHISAKKAADGMNWLRFLDTGPGVPPEQMPRLFDRFYSGLPEGQGTGIGLAFARQVMRSFSGDIMCRSEPGSYCEFILIFPPVDADAA